MCIDLYNPHCSLILYNGNAEARNFSNQLISTEQQVARRLTLGQSRVAPELASNR